MASESAISAIVLTYNEARNIESCLASFAGLCRDIFVVDSGSSDGTTEIALRYASVVHHPFETHARQWSWALTNLPFKTPWVLALDADQQLTPELRSEIIALFGHVDAIPGV